MEGCDFVEWLGADLSNKILMCLDDPSDLVRFSAVSSCWHQLVIENGICKQLCLKMFPEMSTMAHAIGTSNMIEPVEFKTDESVWAYLKREHRVYSFLARGLASFLRTDCISGAISASSTDHPEESIHNTLEPGDWIGERASYWSSKGQSDPEIPETLTYKLVSNLCLVTEIHVRPFQEFAFFQFGFPIYSAKAVKFLMGHPKFGMEVECSRGESSAAKKSCREEFVWTYVSPEFPMAQKNHLQIFKLPEPVLCVGGILQVKLLGKVQKHEMDALYYTCISHVQVVGRPLSSAFDVEILDQTGKCKLKYSSHQHCSLLNKCL